MSKRIVIISGGELEEEFVLSILEKEENQYVIGVDRGMEFLYNHQILPNYIVGDFDSVKKEIGDYYRNETDVPIREFNPMTLQRTTPRPFCKTTRILDRIRKMITCGPPFFSIFQLAV